MKYHRVSNVELGLRMAINTTFKKTLSFELKPLLNGKATVLNNKNFYSETKMRRFTLWIGGKKSARSKTEP